VYPIAKKNGPNTVWEGYYLFFTEETIILLNPPSEYHVCDPSTMEGSDVQSSVKKTSPPSIPAGVVMSVTTDPEPFFVQL